MKRSRQRESIMNFLAGRTDHPYCGSDLHESSPGDTKSESWNRLP